MDATTKKMIAEWVKTHRGDTESVARWMRDTLKIGSIRECRRLIEEATN